MFYSWSNIRYFWQYIFLFFGSSYNNAMIEINFAFIKMNTIRKNISIKNYLVLIWFAYLSSDNNFRANGAINNNEYCSITKQHTMCTPEVRIMHGSIYFNRIYISFGSVVLMGSISCFDLFIGVWTKMWIT